MPRTLLSILLLLLTTSALRAQTLPAEVTALISQLSSDDFHLRDAAQKKLLAHVEAHPQLEALAAKSDSEAGERAATILKYMEWGVRPQTPERVLSLLEKVRYLPRGPLPANATPQQIEEITQNFSLRQSEGVHTLPALMAAALETEDELLAIRAIVERSRARGEVYPDFGDFCGAINNRVLNLICRGDAPKALALYDRVLQIEPADFGQQHYASLALQMGQAPQAIATWEKRAEAGGQIAQCAKRALAQLYCVTGDFPRAVEALESIQQDATGVLIESGNWPQINLPLRSTKYIADFHVNLDSLRILGLEFAGERGKAAAASLELSRRPNSENWNSVAATMLFAGRIDDAVAVVGKNCGPFATARLLLQLGRYHDALDLILPVLKEDPLLTELQCLAFRAEFKLGRPVDARARIKNLLDRDTIDYNLIATLVSVGERESAHRAAAIRLKNDGTVAAMSFICNTTRAALSEVVATHDWPSDYTGVAFMGIRSLNPKETDIEIMKRLEQFVAGKCRADDAVKIKEAAVNFVAGLSGDDDWFPAASYINKIRLLIAFGDEQQAGMLAKEIAERTDWPEFKSFYAHMLETKNDLKGAARIYRKMFETYSFDSVAAYRFSLLLKKLGGADEAMAWRERAKLMPLHYTAENVDLAVALFDDGDLEGAFAAAQTAMRTDRIYVDELRKIVPVFQKAKAYHELLQLWQRCAVDGLTRLNTYFDADDAQFILEVRSGMAEAHVNLGDIPAAIADMEICIQLDPANVKLKDRLAELEAKRPAK